MKFSVEFCGMAKAISGAALAGIGGTSLLAGRCFE
jgi:hypothetical protein